MSNTLQHMILKYIFFPIKDTFGTIGETELALRIRQQYFYNVSLLILMVVLKFYRKNVLVCKKCALKYSRLMRTREANSFEISQKEKFFL